MGKGWRLGLGEGLRLGLEGLGLGRVRVKGGVRVRCGEGVEVRVGIRVRGGDKVRERLGLGVGKGWRLGRGQG